MLPRRARCGLWALLLSIWIVPLAVCSVHAYDEGYDWTLPGPDGNDPINEQDPLEPIHWLLEDQEEGEEVLFGELSCLASGRPAKQKEQREEDGLVASDYSWIVGGNVGDVADWILLGRLLNADAEEGQDTIDAGYLNDRENLLRIALRPSTTDRLKITGRYGRNFRRPDSFYVFGVPGVVNGPLEIREGQYLDLHWSRSLSARSLLRFWTGYSEDEWSQAARGSTEEDIKPPGLYRIGDFDGYENGIRKSYSLAGDLTLESWLTHRIISGFQVENLGLEATTARVDDPELWPYGGNHGWVSDVDIWLTRLYVADRWQGLPELVLEPRLEVVRYGLEEPWNYLTPRLSVIFTPLHNTVLSAGYGYEVTPPSIAYLHERALNDYTNDLWGEPDRESLEPEKAQCVDLGVEQNVLEDYTVGLKATYQWIEDVILAHDIWGLEYDPDPRTTKFFYWNGAEAAAWSLEARLRRRMTDQVAAIAEYVMGEAVGRLANQPDWLRQQEIVEFPAEFHLDWDVRHRVRLALDYNTPQLGGLAASVIWAWHSGTPYTPRSVQGMDMDGNATSEAAEFNSQRLPDWNELDLSVTKDLKLLEGVDVALNVQVQNILDHQNIREVNNDTGTPEPQAFSGNTGNPRTFLAGLVLKF